MSKELSQIDEIVREGNWFFLIIVVQIAEIAVGVLGTVLIALGTTNYKLLCF